MLEKKTLPKKLRTEQFYQILRNEAAGLARLRHPLILKLVHPLDESQMAFCMVTEPLAGTVSNLYLQNYTNLTPLPEEVRDFQPSELAVNNGVRHLTEALAFLHREAKMYHRGLSPDCMFVDPNGTWKIGGFYFSQKVNALGTQMPVVLDFAADLRVASEPDGGRALPALEFVAPELALTTREGKHDHKADVFSLGKLVYVLHKKLSRAGGTGMEAISSLFQLESFCKNLSAGALDTSGLPAALPPLLGALLAVLPGSRMEAGQFLQSAYFNNIKVRTLQYLSTLMDKDLKTRVEFLRRLPTVLDTFDAETCKRQILPPLLFQLQDPTPAVTAVALPVILKILRGATPLEVAPALPALKRVLEVFGRDKAVQLLILSELEAMLAVLPNDTANSHVLPVLKTSLETPDPELFGAGCVALARAQEKQVLSPRLFRTELLPRVADMASRGPALALRVRSLQTLATLAPHCEADALADVILTTAQQCAKNPKDPGELMCCVGVLDTVGRHCGKELLGTGVLPTLCALCVHPLLNEKQFTTVHGITAKALARVEQLQGELFSQRPAAIAPTVQLEPDSGDLESLLARDAAPTFVPEILSNAQQLRQQRTGTLNSGGLTATPSSTPDVAREARSGGAASNNTGVAPAYARPASVALPSTGSNASLPRTVAPAESIVQNTGAPGAFNPASRAGPGDRDRQPDPTTSRDAKAGAFGAHPGGGVSLGIKNSPIPMALPINRGGAVQQQAFAGPPIQPNGPSRLYTTSGNIDSFNSSSVEKAGSGSGSGSAPMSMAQRRALALGGSGGASSSGNPGGYIGNGTTASLSASSGNGGGNANPQGIFGTASVNAEQSMFDVANDTGGFDGLSLADVNSGMSSNSFGGNLFSQGGTIQLNASNGFNNNGNGFNNNGNGFNNNGNCFNNSSSGFNNSGSGFHKTGNFNSNPDDFGSSFDFLN